MIAGRAHGSERSSAWLVLCHSVLFAPFTSNNHDQDHNAWKSPRKCACVLIFVPSTIRYSISLISVKICGDIHGPQSLNPSYFTIRLISVPHLLPAASVGIVFTFWACVRVIMEFFFPWRRLLLWELINKTFGNFCLVWLMSVSLSICVSAKLHTHMWEQHWFTISHLLYSPLFIFLAF